MNLQNPYCRSLFGFSEVCLVYMQLQMTGLGLSLELFVLGLRDTSGLHELYRPLLLRAIVKWRDLGMLV